MPDVATPASVRIFAGALFTGLLWGIAGATVVGGGAMALESAGKTPDTAKALSLVLETASWTALGASVLALFPIGPLAGAIGWALYRRGIVARWAYVLAGAGAAVAAPVLVVTVGLQTMRYPTTTTTNLAVLDDGVALLVAAAFPLLGGFGGFMAARVLRRDHATR
jgi:hypothetical protein